MSLQDIENKVDLLVEKKREEEQALVDKKKKKFKLFKFPRKAKSGAKKQLKDGKFLICYLKNNKDVDFFWAESVMGLIDVDPKYQGLRIKPYHGFEPGAVYNYKYKYPVLVVPEWRLLPIGGVVEDYEQQVLFGGDRDKENAKLLNIMSAAEITLANMMEKKELDANAKKKGNWGWLLWVGVALVGAYILVKVFGWM